MFWKCSNDIYEWLELFIPIKYVMLVLLLFLLLSSLLVFLLLLTKLVKPFVCKTSFRGRDGLSLHVNADSTIKDYIHKKPLIVPL